MYATEHRAASPFSSAGSAMRKRAKRTCKRDSNAVATGLACRQKRASRPHGLVDRGTEQICSSCAFWEEPRAQRERSGTEPR
jgi:hypothetical protein